MENRISARLEEAKETSGGKRYYIFDEKTVNSYLYGTREVRVIDVKKLKRKAEGEQEACSSKKQKIAAEHEEPRLTNAIRSFPDEVQLCLSSIPGESYGVCAKEHIPLGTWIGPYEGRRLSSRNLAMSDKDTAYLWEIYKDGRLSHYIDGSDEDNSSWMRFIRCSRHIKEQNLYAFQYCGNIFYRAFKEIPPGRELLVWYDDKYPQFLGIPLGMQDYDSVTSSSARGSPINSSTSTLLRSDTKKDGFQESRENHQMSNFRVPPTSAVQPRFVPATRSLGSALQRDQLGAPGIRGGPRPVARSGEGKRSETGLPPTSNERQFVRDFPRRPVSNGNDLYSLQQRNKDLQRIAEQEQLKTDNSRDKATRAHVRTDKQLKQQRDKDFVSSNDRSRPQQMHVPHELQRSQLFDNDHQISSGTSEGQALKPSQTGNTVKTLMPALHSCMPPLLHKQFYYEPTETRTLATSPDEFGMWRCRQCLKTFTQRVLLQMHECPQTPEKPYQCGQCTMSFATPSDLRSHVETHTNEKLFKCGFCLRSFSGATTLNNHIRTHTGERPFNCEKCQRTFSQASHLARHQRIPGECVSVEDV
ncbi:uncharacterized protein LOC144651717 [Oculina patagonica]